MTIELNEKEELGAKGTIYCHQFHAEGSALSGNLRAPIKQAIETQVPVELNDRRGGHLTRFVSGVSIEGLVSFKRAETRVSGSKIKNKWVTLATTILEDLNVFEVITVDRVISQVSTSHELENGHIPNVTFLGTKFENLQVCGIPVNVQFNFGVCPPPAKEQAYLLDGTFLKETHNWTENILKKGALFGSAEKQYVDRHAKSSEVLQLIETKEYKALSYHDKVAKLQELFAGDKPRVTCSVVESIDIAKVRKQLPNVETVGHVLVIPDFGAVSLGEVEVGLEMPDVLPYSCHGNGGSRPQPSTYFELTMLNMELGCVGDASIQAARSKTNGTTSP